MISSGVKDNQNTLFTSHRLKVIVLKAIEIAFGLRLTDLKDYDDAELIKHVKRLESMAVSFNILPNGFAQDERVTPSKWTRKRSILYSSLMTVNIIHLMLLSAFDLPQHLSLILGDFFYGHPSRRYFWIYWTNLSIFGEVLRQYWIHLCRNGSFHNKFHMHLTVYAHGFASEALSMNESSCAKYRLVTHNLAVMWCRLIFTSVLGFGPILVLIVQSVSQQSKTPEQFIYTYAWLLTTYLGLVCTLSNLILTGAFVTLDLTYTTFRAITVAATVQDFADKRGFPNKLTFMPQYEKVFREIVIFQNEIEADNMGIRNWLIFLYLGVSFCSDFGFYAAAFVHIDHGSLDFFIISFSAISLFTIGTCSYINGVILIMMHSYGKNLMKTNRNLLLDAKSFIKFTDLQSRLSNTDIAFTIGTILDMTTEVFVIYLLENASLIMMFIVNVT